MCALWPLRFASFCFIIAVSIPSQNQMNKFYRCSRKKTECNEVQMKICARRLNMVVNSWFALYTFHLTFAAIWMFVASNPNNCHSSLLLSSFRLFWFHRNPLHVILFTVRFISVRTQNNNNIERKRTNEWTSDNLCCLLFGIYGGYDNSMASTAQPSETHKSDEN